MLSILRLDREQNIMSLEVRLWKSPRKQNKTCSVASVFSDLDMCMCDIVERKKKKGRTAGGVVLYLKVKLEWKELAWDGRKA